MFVLIFLVDSNANVLQGDIKLEPTENHVKVGVKTIVTEPWRKRAFLNYLRLNHSSSSTSLIIRHRQSLISLMTIHYQ